MHAKLFTINWQGANISQLERDIGSDQFPPNEHYFGLVNVSDNHYYSPPFIYFISNFNQFSFPNSWILCVCGMQ